MSTTKNHKNNNRGIQGSSLLSNILVIVCFAVILGAGIGLTAYAAINKTSDDDKNVCSEKYEISLNNDKFFFIPDTLKKETRTIITEVLDENDNKKKEVRLVMKKDDVKELYIDGKKIPKNEFRENRHLIQAALDEEHEAIQEIREINTKKIQSEIETAMREVEDIDMDEINREIEEAMKEIEELNEGMINNQMELALGAIEDLDIDGIMAEVEEALKEIDCDEIRIKSEKKIKKADMKKMQEELEQARKELKEIDKEKIRIEIEEAMKKVEEIDMEKIMKDAQEAIEVIDREEIKKQVQDALENVKDVSIDMENIHDVIDESLEQNTGTRNMDDKEMENILDELEKENK